MKLYQGEVVKTAMTKTITVMVTRQWVHPKYKKTMRSTKKYLVHDEGGAAKVGETVSFKETRPLSKRKRFTLQSPKKGQPKK